MNLFNHGTNAASAAATRAISEDLQGSTKDLLGSLTAPNLKEFLKDGVATMAAGGGSLIGGLAAEQLTSQLLRSLNVPPPIANLANPVLQGFSNLSVQAGQSMGANIAAPVARAAADNILDKIL